jgi:adenylate cyclase
MMKGLRASLWVWLAVVVTVLGLRGFGALQAIELATYDRLLQQIDRPLSISDRIALIEISEYDIQELGHWPPSDLEITILIESILAVGASSVGLDLYRDLAVPPGERRLEQLLEREPRIVMVFKHGDPSAGGIPGHAALEGTGRLGFSDLLLDPDGRVRRGLLFLDRADGGTDYSFSLQLALQELARDGIHPQPDPVREEWLRLGNTSIPFVEANDGGYVDIDDQGYQIIHDFLQSGGDFEPIPFGTALNGKLQRGSLLDRIVLVGASADSLNDFTLAAEGITHGDVMERGVTGVWLHALLLDQLLRFGQGESRPLQFVSNFAEIVGVMVAALLGCMLAASVGRLGSFSTFGLAIGASGGLCLLGLVGYAALSMGFWIPLVAPGAAWLGASAAYTAWISSLERAQRAELMQIFSQVQSPRVANELWRRRDEYLVDGQLEPEAATVTVLFLDMKGYTASAEKMQPGRLMSWINDFMAPMARLIEEYGGYPDDYFGDGIKADFGVPVLCETEEEVAATARDAVRCAAAMVAELVEINVRYAEANLPTVALRIGIHTGPVVVGLLGSRNKGKYTVVGDAVVTAQRLESTDKVAHDFEEQPCRVLLSQRTHSLLTGHSDVGRFESMGKVALKGKETLVGVYRMDTRRDRESVLKNESGRQVDPG